MSESFSGTVQAIRQDRKAVKINNEWYSVRDSSAFGSASKGDIISGTYTKNGKWINCDEASIVVTPGGGSAPVNGTGHAPGGAKKGGDSGFRSPEEIIRTTALEQANEFFAISSGLDGEEYPDQVEKVLRTADIFTAYIQGNISLTAPEQAAAPVAEPVVVAQPEPAPVQEEAVPAALSSFLGGS